MVNICSADLEYEIRIGGECFSTSDHAIFSDQLNNDTIMVDSVTVSGSTAVLSWQPTTQSDVVSYIVMWFDPALGAYVALDTLPVGTAMPYTWNASTADTRSEQYVIVSLDSCGNQSSELTATPLKSMHLTLNTDPCEGKTHLRWNDYLTFDNATYDLLVDIKDDQLNPIATGQILLASTQQLEYEHTNLVNGYQYCYYVRASNSDGSKTSTSNIECIESLVIKKSRVTLPCEQQCLV